MPQVRIPVTCYLCPVPGCDWSRAVIGWPRRSLVEAMLVDHLAEHGFTQEDMRRWSSIDAAIQEKWGTPDQ